MTTEETRDEAGRLVSVVVDGQRFHRADDAERKVHELRRATLDLARGKANAESVAESLRGVVQAVRDALAGDVQAVFKVAAAQQIIIDSGLAAAADAPQPAGQCSKERRTPCKNGSHVDHPERCVRESGHLGDCAWQDVAPQPAECGERHPNFGRCALPAGHQLPHGRETSAGPSPAVLPETSETKDQR